MELEVGGTCKHLGWVSGRHGARRSSWMSPREKAQPAGAAHEEPWSGREGGMAKREESWVGVEFRKLEYSRTSCKMAEGAKWKAPRAYDPHDCASL